MSRTKLLLDVIDDMHRLADSLQCVADSLAGSAPPAEQPDQPPTPQLEDSMIPPITIDQVRAVLVERTVRARPEKSRHFCTSTTPESCLT